MEHHKDNIPPKIFSILAAKGFDSLRPSQEKSVNAGLFSGCNLLVCTPTASGKTLVGELGLINAVYEKGLKGVYIVPLRALASEKYNHFKTEYPDLRVGIGSGDVDGPDSYLTNCDIIVLTSEKFDSLIRHKVEWIREIGCLVVDEIHLLGDVSRGPTLEIVITIVRSILKNCQIIGLSATIGNSAELAEWLDAKLIEDSWRPVKLEKGVYFDKDITFLEDSDKNI